MDLCGTTGFVLENQPDGERKWFQRAIATTLGFRACTFQPHCGTSSGPLACEAQRPGKRSWRLIRSSGRHLSIYQSRGTCFFSKHPCLSAGTWNLNTESEQTVGALEFVQSPSLWVNPSAVIELISKSLKSISEEA
mmetsp:Transcript_18272/g.28412  ORF Transcript_18272/g.28412 Transcript_18272/m.28412 type:complete len:136 (-) Transcript_18272:988-1395(-)